MPIISQSLFHADASAGGVRRAKPEEVRRATYDVRGLRLFMTAKVANEAKEHAFDSRGFLIQPRKFCLGDIPLIICDI